MELFKNITEKWLNASHSISFKALIKIFKQCNHNNFISFYMIWELFHSSIFHSSSDIQTRTVYILFKNENENNTN